MKVNLAEIKFDDAGLIPAIVQDVHTREVLTLAYMNSESLSLTLETGQTWFWSRSRQQLWKKGETSGNTQEVVEIKVDCDNDALVLLVNPAGPACHTGATSCFHNSAEDAREGSRVNKSSANTLSDLYELIARRKQERPDGSYTTYLFDEGLDKILKKVGEESAESIIAAKNQDPQRLVSEVADLTFHLLVMLVEKGVSLEQIQAELENRSKKRLTEKNA
ncbi:MAG TPA: bifunctional phosphoribosyl-AMP cyclohydrolase/phosphoribosyl-ATP diphosphatase HisIE [Pyrinomonadaceae bacterium]|jgi:phosphoribosyl-AMP cyclohydrolase / phosphoribosyl-ATP pyrophosphohydrolase|nr:bifunctional phosphoribosyl-AMP cyclohydrolase/phosphoribosyl-ATP diphosphatase HisIE [Pyrinomonadaceae bacterium]